MCDSKLCTKKEVAAKLNCSETTVDRIRKDGLLNEIRIFRVGLRFRKIDVENLVNKNTYYSGEVPEVVVNEKSNKYLNLDAFERKYLKKSNKGEGSVRKKRLSWDYGRKGVFLRETKKGGTWYIWFYRKEKNGNWARVKERVPDAQNRGDAIAAMLKAFEAERRKDALGREGKKTSTFKEFSRVYLENYAKVSKRSWKSDEKYLEKHVLPFFGKMLLADITSEIVSEFLSLKQKEGLQGNTRNRYMQLLRKMINLAADWDYEVKNNPVKSYHLVKEDAFKRSEVFSLEEYKKLLEASPPHLRSILICAWNTGMRKTEILSLQWKDVHIEVNKPYLVVRAENSKTDRERRIPLNEALVKELSVLKAQNGKMSSHVFCYRKSEKKVPRPIKEFKNAFLSVCKTTGIEGKRFHDFRHTFGTRALEQGANPIAVKEILGHSRLKTTETYLHANLKQMENAVSLVGQNEKERDRFYEILSRFSPVAKEEEEKVKLTLLFSRN